MSEHPPFYGHPIIVREEQETIRDLLSKYRNEPVNNELKEKVWNELQEAKHKGLITVPFKVVLRKDAMDKYPPSIEVIVDTKV